MNTQRKYYGWCGQILKVNLSSGKIAKEPLDEKLMHDFLGGRGINDAILYDETGPNTDPLEPDNVMLIGTGPLNGTPVMQSGRLQITAKSPLNTSRFGLSNSGGEFAPELKYAGYDLIVVYGKADKPVYLLIRDDKVELKDASQLWGKTTVEAGIMIRDQIGDPGIQTLTIGPAGENLVRWALIMANAPWGASGRTGMGAVMGSKNLKAIAVRGTQPVYMAASYDDFMKVNKKWIDKTRENPGFDIWAYHGTSELVSPQSVFLTTHNHRIHGWDMKKRKELWSENYLHKYLVRHKGCTACQFCCSGAIQINDGPFKGLCCKKAEGGVFESIGAGLDISYPPAGFKMASLFDEYGMDSIAGGQILAVACEWYEKGIISKKDTGGIELNWGDYNAMIKIIPKIAYREDIGDILAEGSVRAGQALGVDEETTPHIKGEEQHGGVQCYPMPATTLGAVVSPIGWDHKMGMPFAAEMGGGWLPKEHPIAKLLAPYSQWDVVPEKADAEIWMERICAIADSIGFCKLATAWYYNPVIELDAMSEFLSVVSGIDYGIRELETIADRIWNLERAFIVREGIRREDDRIAPRVDQRRNAGPFEGRLIDKRQFEDLLDAFYEKRGWDKKTGIPNQETLRRYGLEKVWDDLAKRGVFKHEANIATQDTLQDLKRIVDNNKKGSKKKRIQ
jgi:aldehyde:ferredoxin oxidoreductase